MDRVSLIKLSYYFFDEFYICFEVMINLISHYLLNYSRSLKHYFLFSSAIFSFYLLAANVNVLEVSIVFKIGLPSYWNIIFMFTLFESFPLIFRILNWKYPWFFMFTNMNLLLFVWSIDVMGELWSLITFIYCEIVDVRWPY